MIVEEQCSCGAKFRVQAETYVSSKTLNEMIKEWRTNHRHEMSTSVVNVINETPSPVGGVENGSNEEST
jgi:hypothetical protein